MLFFRVLFTSKYCGTESDGEDKITYSGEAILHFCFPSQCVCVCVWGGGGGV